MYQNQQEALLMLERIPFAFPVLEIVADKELHPAEYTSSHIKIHNYTSHPAINLPMAV